jgi:thiamine pyrophosphate-dependent acetolactate synthase large subunit-like protein
MAEKEDRGASGAETLAAMLAGHGVSHVLFVDAILRHSLIAMEDIGIRCILAHSEKAAACMADRCTRTTGRAGVVMAPSVGAANLAAGLQDATLHRTPIVAMTGRKPPSAQNRNADQEIAHRPRWQPVPVFDADGDQADALPRLLRQAFRAAAGRLAVARKPVIVAGAGAMLWGDGAICYHLTELETARRHDVPVKRVIKNDSAFGQGLITVRRTQGNLPAAPDDIMRFGPTDFAAIARRRRRGHQGRTGRGDRPCPGPPARHRRADGGGCHDGRSNPRGGTLGARRMMTERTIT